MSRKSCYFIIFNVQNERSITVYGRYTVAKYLRENGCKFDDKRLDLVKGENAVVFSNKEGKSFIVEEGYDAEN